MSDFDADKFGFMIAMNAMPLVGVGDGQTRVINEQHYISRIIALEAENARLTTELAGARAAMAKEAADAWLAPIEALQMKHDEAEKHFGLSGYASEYGRQMSRISDEISTRKHYAQAILALAEAPQGYVCVPIEPTEEMVEAGIKEAKGHIEQDEECSYLPESEYHWIYRAMITKATP